MAKKTRARKDESKDCCDGEKIKKNGSSESIRQLLFNNPRIYFLNYSIIILNYANNDKLFTTIKLIGLVKDINEHIGFDLEFYYSNRS